MHPTAMARRRVSKPMEWIVKNVDLAGNILHFGEGKAYDDTELLTKYGRTYVYEPYPFTARTFYYMEPDVTMLDKRELPDTNFDYIIAIYVLNVLEPIERDGVIEWMKSHGDVAIAAVRTDKINGLPAFDGVKTSIGTFQKSFSELDCASIGKVLTFNSSFAIVEL